jgi:hypothetical protein
VVAPVGEASIRTASVDSTPTTETVIDYTIPAPGGASYLKLPATPEEALARTVPYLPHTFPRDISTYTRRQSDNQHVTFESGPWTISVEVLGDGWVVTTMAGPT